MSIPVKFIINQNTQVANIGSDIQSFSTKFEFEISVQLFVLGLNKITSVFAIFNDILFAFNLTTSRFKSLLKSHRQISKKRCFEKYCPGDKACQFSAL